MRILPLLIATATLLYSCDKKDSASTENAAIIATASDSTNASVAKSSSDVTSQDATAVAANTPSDKPALNPEHGMPYHRCEIAVGAPIDSAPTQNAAPQVVPQQTAATSSFNTNPISPSLAPAPAPASVPASGPKPANNPAHGEPHHRCDLEVGAPLT